MNHEIILGNIVSAIAAFLLILSCTTGNTKRVFLYQVIENIVLAISSVIFGSYAAASSALLSTVRSAVVLKNRYSKKTMLAFAVIITAFGLATNTKGIVGLLPVIATLEFTCCNYYFTDIIGIKWTLIVNLLLWDVYAFIIHDYSSGITWAVTLIITILSLIKLKKQAIHFK